MAHWEHFEHLADMGIRGYGATLAEAFEQAALALTAVVTDPATVEPRTPVALDCRAGDRELLLVAWLNALVLEMAAQHLLFSRFAVDIAADQLHATAWGEPVDRARHAPAVEVKGATLTALSVAPATDGGWIAQCVIDV